MLITAHDLAHLWRLTTRDELPFTVSMQNPVVRNLAIPCSESNIKTPNLCRCEAFNGISSAPVLNPLTALARNVNAHPTHLRFAAKVHATDRHILQLNRAGLPKAQYPFLAGEQMKITSPVSIHRTQRIKNLDGFIFGPKRSQSTVVFITLHSLMEDWVFGGF